MAKREREVDKFETLGKISHTSPNAKLHGVILSLSPMQRGKTCSYFHGQVTDGDSSVCIFGFDVGVRKKLAFFEGNKQAVTITNCEVKASKRSKALEILVNKNTDVAQSDKQFDIKSSTCALSKGGSTIELGELQNLDKYQCVNVKAKALRLEDVEEVPRGKKVQNIVITDNTATARLSVWEGEIGKVVAGKSYNLTALVVREFRGRKFLSMSKDKLDILATEDITEVADETESNNSATNTATPSYSWVRNCSVIGVMTFDKYKCCINCNTKRAPDPEDPDVGHCSKCQMIQCLDTSKGLMAKLMLASGGTKYTLCAFGKVVETIADTSSDQVNISTILKAKPFKMIHVNLSHESLDLSLQYPYITTHLRCILST